MATAGTRGKWAEAQVRKWMQVRSDAEAAFWFYRYPDPRAGSLQAVPADFGAMQRGTPLLIEVKEVKITTLTSRRLPQANFSTDKVARMRKFRMAGGQGWVVICHMPAKEWRLVPIDHFFERKPSWDVEGFKAYKKVDEVLEELFGRLK